MTSSRAASSGRQHQDRVINAMQTAINQLNAQLFDIRFVIVASKMFILIFNTVHYMNRMLNVFNYTIVNWQLLHLLDIRINN
jgi:hypothetical protein